MPELIGLGEAMVEMYADQPLGSATQLQKSCGGDVLNALVMAQRLGTSTGFYTRVGNDPFGQGLLEFCQFEGVDTSQAKMVNGENGVYFISLQPSGEREFTYRRVGSAASQYGLYDLDQEAIQKSQMLLVSGISQAISKSAKEAVLGAAKMAREGGVKVAFDPNYRPKLWENQGGLGAAQQAYLNLEPYLDILLPSFPADLSIFGLELHSQSDALQALQQRCAIVAMKSGIDGVWLGTQQTQLQIPAFKAVVCDTTGAGDAWNGAFLHGYLKHQPLIESAREANRMAAWKLAYRGAIPNRQVFDSYVET